MYYRLNDKLMLRGWQKLPYALVEKGYSRPLFINALEMQTLQMCNGKIDLSLPLIPQKVRDLLPELERRRIIIHLLNVCAVAPLSSLLPHT